MVALSVMLSLYYHFSCAATHHNICYVSPTEMPEAAFSAEQAAAMKTTSSSWETHEYGTSTSRLAHLSATTPPLDPMKQLDSVTITSMIHAYVCTWYEN